LTLNDEATRQRKTRLRVEFFLTDFNVQQAVDEDPQGLHSQVPTRQTVVDIDHASE
jgi:hypothetical protein